MTVDWQRLAPLCTTMDLEKGEIPGLPLKQTHLSDFKEYFSDAAACEAALADGADPLVYQVAWYEAPSEQDEGDLHYGLGKLMPGRVGDEYYMTKGHFHAWRPAAEVYIGLKGEGMMVFEDEETGHTELKPLGAGQIVYVPGSTAHRTVNTGTEPLLYLGVYSARAGHDYGAISERNFLQALVARENGPTLIDRKEYLASL